MVWTVKSLSHFYYIIIKNALESTSAGSFFLTYFILPRVDVALYFQCVDSKVELLTNVSVE